MQRDYLPFSPLIPATPDWQALAVECSRAYSALVRVQSSVRDGMADGVDYWTALTRMEKAASVIASWSSDPELYGRLLARRAIMAGIQTAQTGMCPLTADNRSQVGHCEQCNYNLGI